MEWRAAFAALALKSPEQIGLPVPLPPSPAPCRYAADPGGCRSPAPLLALCLTPLSGPSRYVGDRVRVRNNNHLAGRGGANGRRGSLDNGRGGGGGGAEGLVMYIGPTAFGGGRPMVGLRMDDRRWCRSVAQH